MITGTVCDEIKEGKFTILKDGGRYEIDCLNFYIKDGFLVIHHKDGDIEYFPESKIYVVIRYRADNKN